MSAVFVDNLIWQNLSFNEHALWSRVPIVGQIIINMVLANKLDGICGLTITPLIGNSLRGFIYVVLPM